MYKKKVVQDLGRNRHTASTIRPPPPPPHHHLPPKKVAPRYRGLEGVKIKKFIGGSFSLLK